MIKKLISTALILFSSVSLANVNRLPMEGKYDCQGAELDSAIPFRCEMVIKKTSETYASTAKCNDGSSLSGNGIYVEKIHAIVSAFGEPSRGGEPGVTISYLSSDGVMNVDWTYLNTTKIGHTRCVKKK